MSSADFVLRITGGASRDLDIDGERTHEVEPGKIGPLSDLMAHVPVAGGEADAAA